MSDELINKKEALNLLRKRSQQLVGIYGDLGGAVSGAARLIDELPTADRPQAEWIELYRDGFGNLICMCSKCAYHAKKSRYCPFCGKRMKGVEDDN